MEVTFLFILSISFSGPSHVLVLARGEKPDGDESVVDVWLRLAGPDDPEEAKKSHPDR